MNIILLIIVIILFSIFLVLFKPIKIAFLFDTDNMIMRLTLNILDIIRIKIKPVEYKKHISVYFKNRQILSWLLKKKSKTDKSIFKALNLQDTCIKLFYGLNRPHLTGMLYSAIALADSYINIKEIEQFPDFTTFNEYLRIELNTKLYAGRTLLNLYKLKKGEIIWTR